MKVKYKKGRMVQFYEPGCLTTIPPEPPPLLTGPDVAEIMKRGKSVGSAG